MKLSFTAVMLAIFASSSLAQSCNNDLGVCRAGQCQPKDEASGLRPFPGRFVECQTAAEQEGKNPLDIRANGKENNNKAKENNNKPKANDNKPKANNNKPKANDNNKPKANNNKPKANDNKPKANNNKPKVRIGATCDKNQGTCNKNAQCVPKNRNTNKGQPFKNGAKFAECTQ